MFLRQLQLRCSSSLQYITTVVVECMNVGYQYWRGYQTAFPLLKNTVLNRYSYLELPYVKAASKYCLLS